MPCRSSRMRCQSFRSATAKEIGFRISRGTRSSAVRPGDVRSARYVRRALEHGWSGRRTVKAIVVTDQAAGTAGMTLVERPEPPAAINDVVVEVHASGFVPT